MLLQVRKLRACAPEALEFPASPMARRYFIKTFGCQMNEYDSARMADVLHAGGDLSATDNPAEADVLLMNTCSVREKAQEKVFSLLGEWRKLKAERPHVVIGVGGCVASQEGEAITSGPRLWTSSSGRRRCTVCRT